MIMNEEMLLTASRSIPVCEYNLIEAQKTSHLSNSFTWQWRENYLVHYLHPKKLYKIK